MNGETDILEIKKRLKKLETAPPLPFHTHTGVDMNKVRFTDLDRRIETVYHSIVGTAAATDTNYGVFFIAPAPCIVTTFKEVHQTAGTDGGSVTLQLEKLTGTTAPDAGTALLSTALSLKATANTVQTGTIVTTISSINLATGDRLCLKDAGVLTAVANVTVQLEVTFI